MGLTGKREPLSNKARATVPSGLTPLKQIRAKCIDCAGTHKAITWCGLVHCPIWHYRFGKHPANNFERFGPLLDQNMVTSALFTYPYKSLPSGIVRAKKLLDDYENGLISEDNLE